MHEDDGTDVLLSSQLLWQSLALPTSSNVVPVTLALTFSARPAAGEPLVSALVVQARLPYTRETSGKAEIKVNLN